MDRLERLEEASQRHSTLLAAAEATNQSLLGLMAQMQQHLVQLGTPAPAPAPPAPAPLPPSLPEGPEPRVGAPEKFGGEPESCQPFITNCELMFALQPRTFSTEQARVAYAINHLTGRARLWGTAEWDRRSPACTSFSLFATELRKVFDLGPTSSEASRDLMSIRQGSRTVADFSIDFRTLASRSTWNTPALVDAFLHSLADYIKDELVSFEAPTTLDGAIELAVRIDRRIQARRRERSRQAQRHPLLNQRREGPPVQPSSSLATSHQSSPEPMEIGRSALSPEERQRRLSAGLCLYCGGGGHRVASCPAKVRAHQL